MTTAVVTGVFTLLGGIVAVFAAHLTTSRSEQRLTGTRVREHARERILGMAVSVAAFNAVASSLTTAMQAEVRARRAMMTEEYANEAFRQANEAAMTIRSVRLESVARGWGRAQNLAEQILVLVRDLQSAVLLAQAGGISDQEATDIRGKVEQLWTLADQVADVAYAAGVPQD